MKEQTWARLLVGWHAADQHVARVVRRLRQGALRSMGHGLSWRAVLAAVAVVVALMEQ